MMTSMQKSRGGQRKRDIVQYLICFEHVFNIIWTIHQSASHLDASELTLPGL